MCQIVVSSSCCLRLMAWWPECQWAGARCGGYQRTGRSGGGRGWAQALPWAHTGPGSRSAEAGHQTSDAERWLCSGWSWPRLEDGADTGHCAVGCGHQGLPHVQRKCHARQYPRSNFSWLDMIVCFHLSLNSDGNAVHIFHECPNFKLYNLQDKPSSFTVQNGGWVVYEKPNYMVKYIFLNIVSLVSRKSFLIREEVWRVWMEIASRMTQTIPKDWSSSNGRQVFKCIAIL